MRRLVGLCFACSLLPSLAWAETAEKLTTIMLNCHYEKAYDKGRKKKSSDLFSATVNMQKLKDGPPIALIKATTFGCFDYIGSFSELEVSGECQRVVGHINFKATLRINRVNGALEHDLLIGNDLIEFYGHCKLQQRLF